MDKILQFINKKTNNKYENLLFFGAVYTKSSSTMQLEFMFKDKEQKSRENQDEIKKLCQEYIGNLAKKIVVKFVNSSITMQNFKNLIFQELFNELKFNEADKNRVNFDYENDITIVTLNYQEGAYNIELLNEVKDRIESLIFEKTGQKIDIQFKEISEKKSNILENRKAQVLEDNFIYDEISKSHIVKLTDVKVLYGNFDADIAYLAGNEFDYTGDSFAVVGAVKSCSIKEVKNKSSDQERTGVRKYMSMELEYDGNSTKFLWFLTKNDAEIKEFASGTILAISAKVNSFSEHNNLRVVGIAGCKFVEPKKVWRKSPKNYRYIKPEKYEFTQQTNFFFEEKKTEKEYLLNNTFVVYDLETTGINTEVCKIIDIGAFKIVEGKIVEKFCTFVNPECEIPIEASKVNRITNILVENSPTIEMALPDFYKFCEGSIIVGYNNIGFDDHFIDREGRKQLYNFDNARDDVFNIAKSKIFGLKNYKLSTVCQAMDVPLIDAHRAASDALATAKLFIKLVEKYY